MERWLVRAGTRIVLVVSVTVSLQSVDRMTLVNETHTPSGRDGSQQSTRIDALFAQWNRPDSPGCGVGVSRDGILEFERGYGMADLAHGIPITPKTVFPIASISKQFTAMAVLLLADRRQLTLDDDVRTYIPELPDYGRRISLRHLLTHTSGLRNGFQLLRLAGWRDEDVMTHEDILRILARQTGVNASPGTEYMYNNSAFTLLAIIVERVSGQSLSAFAGANIFTPLGMKTARFNDDSSVIVPNRASGYYVAGRGDGRGFPGNVMADADLRDLRVGPARGESIGPGGAEMTVSEILDWQDNFTEPRVGTPAMTSQMQTPFTLANGEKTAYGFGLTIGRHRGLVEVGHGGSHVGWDLRVSRYPDRRLAVAVFCNLENIASSTLTRQVADIYLEGVFSPAAPAGRPATVPLTHVQLVSREGLYRNRDDDQWRRLIVRDDALRMFGGTLDSEQAVLLNPLSANLFVSPGSTFTFEFVSPGGAEPQRFHVLDGEGRRMAVYERVREFTPSQAQLRGFAGAYTSTELGVTFTIVANPSGLLLQLPRGTSYSLRPTFTDAFEDARAGPSFVRSPEALYDFAPRVIFTRDARRRLTGLRLRTSQIKNLRLDRVGPKQLERLRSLGHLW